MRTYICIDLKTFYASCECVDRGLDPFKTNLVVCDPSRGNGGICLAVSPKMKNQGVKNRCRIFEIPKNIDYIVAKPRMKYYIEHAADIYAIYLKYISKDDIHVYSIDECFMDVTKYLKLYEMSAKDLANMIMKDVYQTTGISSACGIGSNLFLAKIALDITAKHTDDNIGILDEEEFKKTMWHHRPITDIWNIGGGIARRLEKYNVYDLKGITELDEKILYKEFGVNAEFLIDHAYGRESCTIKDIHNYKSKSNSLTNGQILFEDYKYGDALLVVKEMVDILVLELVEKKLVTNNISIYVGYSKDVIKATGGSMKILEYTNSYKLLREYFVNLFEKTTNKNHLIRRINISVNNVIGEEFTSISLFTNIEEDAKERKIQETILEIKQKYGKNAILKGMNLEEKATTRARNKLIGGHNGE